jgi:hypothetical protein
MLDMAQAPDDWFSEDGAQSRRVGEYRRLRPSV